MYDDRHKQGISTPDNVFWRKEVTPKTKQA